MNTHNAKPSASLSAALHHSAKPLLLNLTSSKQQKKELHGYCRPSCLVELSLRQASGPSHRNSSSQRCISRTSQHRGKAQQAFRGSGDNVSKAKYEDGPEFLYDCLSNTLLQCWRARNSRGPDFYERMYFPIGQSHPPLITQKRKLDMLCFVPAKAAWLVHPTYTAVHPQNDCSPFVIMPCHLLA